jgi:hypothetical protein
VNAYYYLKKTAAFKSEAEETKARITAFAKYSVAMNIIEAFAGQGI